MRMLSKLAVAVAIATATAAAPAVASDARVSGPGAIASPGGGGYTPNARVGGGGAPTRDARVGGYSPAPSYGRDQRVGGYGYGHYDDDDEGGYGLAAGLGLGLLGAGGYYYGGGYDEPGYYGPGYYDPGYYRPRPYVYESAPARYPIGRYCATPQKTCLLYDPSEVGLHCSCRAPRGGHFYGHVAR